MQITYKNCFLALTPLHISFALVVYCASSYIYKKSRIQLSYLLYELNFFYEENTTYFNTQKKYFNMHQISCVTRTHDIRKHKIFSGYTSGPLVLTMMCYVEKKLPSYATYVPHEDNKIPTNYISIRRQNHCSRLFMLFHFYR